MASLGDAVTAKLLQTRSVVRAPIWLYRHRLGLLLGTRILMLEHTGHRSGLPRYVCLEVVEAPSPGVLVVASGFGTTAQWYRNLARRPACRVSIGARRAVPATAHLMSDDESAATLARYQRAHPGAWRRLRGAIERATGRPVDGIPMVRLTLTPS